MPITIRVKSETGPYYVIMKPLIWIVFFLSLTSIGLSEIIFFSGETPKNDYELFKYDTSTSELTQLTQLKGFISGFDFSEDGQKLYFGLLSTMKNGLYELHLKNGEIKPLLVDQHDNRQPCVIDEGRLIFVSYRSKKESLFLLDLNTMKIEPFIVLEGYEFSPAISHNKQLLAFVHSENTYEHDGQLYLYNMTTKEMNNLSGEHFGDYSPSFSPDSQEIIFSSYRERGQQAIFCLDISSGEVEKITPFYGTTDRFPVFDKDGEWVYFSTLKGKHKIARMKPDGSQREILEVYPNDLNTGSFLLK